MKQAAGLLLSLPHLALCFACSFPTFPLVSGLFQLPFTTWVPLPPLPPLLQVLLFTSTVDASFRVKLFLEQFSLRAALLNSELPVNSRLHILQDFNKGAFKCLIAAAAPGQSDAATSAGEFVEGVEGDANGSGHAEEGMEGGGAERKEKGKRRRNRRGGRGDDDERGEMGAVRGIDFRNVRTVSAPNGPSLGILCSYSAGLVGHGKQAAIETLQKGPFLLL